jgi:hypothetical protein
MHTQYMMYRCATINHHCYNIRRMMLSLIFVWGANREGITMNHALLRPCRLQSKSHKIFKNWGLAVTPI